MDKTGKVASERHGVANAVLGGLDGKPAVLADRQIHQTSADGQRARAKAQGCINIGRCIESADGWAQGVMRGEVAPELERGVQ